DRDDLVRDSLTRPNIRPGDLRLLCITTDSGMGKSVAIDWLLRRCSEPGHNRLAFKWELHDKIKLPNEKSGTDLDAWLLRQMADELCALEEPRRTWQEFLPVVDYLRRSGQLVLLFDGLDQAPDRIGLLAWLVESSYWKACRFVVAGRPYVLQTYWDTRF